MGNSTREQSNANSSAVQNQSGAIKLLASKHVSRPQLNFRDRIDNSSNPFMPQLKDKPHSKKPISILIEYEDDGTEFYRLAASLSCKRHILFEILMNLGSTSERRF